ncbi:DNA polymerase zeta [Podila horticola]|nr:DNA polymerase zeta [Podila horticola]
MNTSMLLPLSNEAQDLLHGFTNDSEMATSEPTSHQDTTSIPLEFDRVDSSARSTRFKSRIADLDYSMQVPGPLDLHACQFLPPHIPVLKVPVFRIFGANEAGQKCCVHIHQAYPYFYIPYEGSLEPAKLQSYIQQLGMSLNHAAAITFNAPQDLRKSQYVAAITLVKGIPFYGYYVGYSYFLKIYLFNPDFESRIVELMRSGAIMATHFQPFEAHVPYKLQFFIDYNLYGMGWLELEDALLRRDVPDPRVGDSPLRMTKATVANTQIWSPENNPGRISTCEIEMDTTVDRIINRDRAPERDTHKNLGECFKPPSSTAQVPSMAGLWEDDARRRKASKLPSQELPKTQARDEESVPWLNHDFSKHMVADLVHEMMQQSQAHTAHQIGSTFESFKIKEDPLAASYMTAYASVDFLCPRILNDKDAPEQSQNESFVYNEADSSIVVDESKISQSGSMHLEDKMGVQKELFKGLTGLGGLEDQEEDEFPLPDMDDFDVEDLMDDPDWDDFNTSDTDAQDPGYDSGNPADLEEHSIPQFDGSGDRSGSQDSKDTKKTPDQEWKKIALSAKQKRTRSSSSSSLTSREKAGKTGRRFCEIVADVGPNLSSTLTLKNPTPAPTTSSVIAPARQLPTPPSSTRTHTSRVTAARHRLSGPAPSAPVLTRSPIKSSQERITKRCGLEPSAPAILPRSPIKSSQVKTDCDKGRNKFRGKMIVQCVEIPVQSWNNLSHDPGPRKTTSPRIKPALKPSVSDDPIIDDDDDDFGSVREEPPKSQSIHISQEIIHDDDGDMNNLRTQENDLSRLKLEYDFPQPASPSRTYFMAAMDELWSSPSPPPERSAFIHSPPRPTTPTRKHVRRVSFAAISSSHLSQRPVAHHNEIKDIQDEDDEMEIEDKEMPAQDNMNDIDGQVFYQDVRDDSFMVNQTFILDDDTALSRSQPVAPESKRPGRVLVEDSFSHSQSGLTPTSQPHAEPTGVYRFSLPPPTVHSLQDSLAHHNLPNFVHQKPYFSNEADVPSRVKVFGGREFRLQSHGLHTMKAFKTKLDLGYQQNQPSRPGTGFKYWEPIQHPPSRAKIDEWLKEDDRRAKASLRSAAEASTQKRREKISQIEGPTQKNPFGYKNSPTKVAGSVAIEKDFMDVLSLEVHCQTRGGLLPDPKHDPVLAVFYCLQTEREEVASNGWMPGYRIGVITHAEAEMIPKLATGFPGLDVLVARDESDMMNALIHRVRELDPDILTGYEVNNLSWGYLVDRYLTLFGLDLSKLLSRIRPLRPPVLTKSALEARDSFNSTHNSGLKFQGRHLFNVWRLIRNEVALTNYSFCNVVFHVLQQRVPHYSHETLTKWWQSGSPVQQARVFRNYLQQVQYNLQLVERQELISRTCEFARVFGVDFFSVISRGSQYKVESLMIRLAKPENFIMITPSRAQVGQQRALEIIPMVMEPESGFYEDPVVVLDFQSLYPSVMIAYNYCYSTCLGKLGGGTKLGVTEYMIQDGILPLLQDHLQVAPNNVMYVNQDIRKSLLSRMLSEILDTRVMVKKAMKEYPNNKSLLKLLEARQLGLKFIANVTYGYTSASYSGRMPGIEIADSIVLSGRETLERAIRFVNENPKWNAKVVYGDTDSMFVHLKGRTREEAFEIGYDISETITRMNPRPVKLKFEKVYHPCFLVTKKRYVGSSYETPQQKEPIFDAKGIETIRRDGIIAAQKIMETTIKTMFRTQDLSQVKTYFVRQLTKILEGRIPVPDLMFGKEVRMDRYSDKGVPPPGAIVSARRMALDPRAQPQYGERVPYVVVYGDPGARLTDQVVEPKELLKNKDLRLNGEYYIRKMIIPSLERIFQLAGADVKSWFDEMPRVKRATPLLITEPSEVLPTAATSAMVAAETDVAMANSLVEAVGAATNSGSESKESPGGPSTSTSGQQPQQQQQPDESSRRFKPRRRGGKGFVSIGSRIDRYYQSQMCIICSRLIVGQTLVKDCTSETGRVKSMLAIQTRLHKAEALARATIEVCSSCCRSPPGGGAGVQRTMVKTGSGEVAVALKNPLSDGGRGLEVVACESLECGVFWQRRKAQDAMQVARQVAVRVIQDLEDLF